MSSKEGSRSMEGTLKPIPFTRSRVLPRGLHSAAVATSPYVVWRISWSKGSTLKARYVEIYKPLSLLGYLLEQSLAGVIFLFVFFSYDFTTYHFYCFQGTQSKHYGLAFNHQNFSKKWFVSSEENNTE